MDIEQLYNDYSIEYKMGGHKHCRPGWVNCECPWCSGTYGHSGYHLGYHIESNHFVCWRCGFHPVVPTIALLLNITNKAAYNLIGGYGLLLTYTQPMERIVNKIPHKWPSGVTVLSERHKKYLEGRGYDPEYLEKKYSLLSSGPISLLDNLNYRFRIMIPYFWDYEQVSFDSRDTTGKQGVKYLACPLAREKIPHKEILYGIQEKWNPKVGICVEGTTDVWRFGNSSFAVSGIKFTPKQVRLIAKTFKRVPVCFDGGEPQAIEQANKLVGELKFRGVDSFRVDIEGDPGSMDQKEANYLVKQLTS